MGLSTSRLNMELHVKFYELDCYEGTDETIVVDLSVQNKDLKQQLKAMLIRLATAPYRDSKHAVLEEIRLVPEGRVRAEGLTELGIKGAFLSVTQEEGMKEHLDKIKSLHLSVGKVLFPYVEYETEQLDRYYVENVPYYIKELNLTVMEWVNAPIELEEAVNKAFGWSRPKK